jgi:hypothetical protein
MSITFARLTLLVVLSTPVLEAQGVASAPLQRLAVLIGAWDVEDIYRSISGVEIRERGVRRCAWVLRDRYVECVTQGRNASGREREYRWLINYNSETTQYELTGFFSNVTFKDHKTFRIDSTGTVWNIRSPASRGDDGVHQWSGAELRFEGRDRAVWTAYRNLETGPISEWTQSTRETWVRRTEP